MSWFRQARKGAEAIRSIEVTEVSDYRWRSEYGGLKGDQVKRLRSLETEKAHDVIDVLSDLFSLRGAPGHIRSDNGPEFIAKAVRDLIAAVGSATAFIEPGSPWENGYCESFNAKLRDELLNGEVFYTLKEASVVIEQWRTHYNSIRPHSSLGYLTPAPEVLIWPAKPSGSVPPARPAVVTRPTMH